MTDLFGDIKNYLPKYLSAEATAKLFAELDQFPKNIDDRLYSRKVGKEQDIFQGDGLDSLWVVNLPDQKVGKARVMVLSNTCDISRGNKRILPPSINYCPIVSLSKFRRVMEEGGKKFGAGQVENFISDIKGQRVSTIFFLPKNAKLGEDSIALLDRFTHCDSRHCNIDQLIVNRLFSLSNYGFYLFLFKLSIHLTRIREETDRDAVAIGKN